MSKTSGIIEVYQSLKTEHWLFRVKSNNGQVIAISQKYRSKTGVQFGVNALLKALDGDVKIKYMK